MARSTAAAVVSCSQYATVAELKAAVSPDDVAASIELGDCYRSLAAKETGSSDKQYQADFEARLLADPAAPHLTKAQVSAWRALNDQTRGQARLSWGSRSRTPEHVEVGLLLQGADGSSALSDLDAKAGSSLRTMFATSSADAMQLEHEESWESPPNPLRPIVHRVHARRYRRTHAGLPVFGDVYSVTTRTAETAGRWVAFVFARWTRDVAGVATKPSISADLATASAQASGEVPAGLATQPPALGIYSDLDQVELAYEVLLGNTVGERWIYYVSAGTGAILAKADRVAHQYSGSLRVPVGRPFEGASKTARPLSYTRIYEHETSATAGGCGSSPASRTVGNPNLLLGSTDLLGTYTNLGGSGDTSWVVDYYGTYVRDKGPQTDYTEPFPAGGTYTFSSTSLNRRRRAEVYYLLNWGSRLYRDGAFNIQQYVPVAFGYYDPADSTECTNTTTELHYLNCCWGETDGECVKLNCEFGTQSGTASANRRLREVVLHEQNHTLKEVAGGFCLASCSNGILPNTDGAECNCYEEGRAMFGGLAATKYEAIRPGDYRPSYTYPADETGLYRAGARWTAIYAHYMLHGGVGTTLKEVHNNLSLEDANTRMVGACSDTNGDGYLVVSECPANSHYRHLLDADTALWTAKEQRLHEISEVFHYHVTDAVRGVAGNQSFPWADELPNFLGTPPFSDGAEWGTVATTITQGPEPGSGSLRFERSDDYDVIMFHGRANEAYYVETVNLGPNVDTMLEIVDKGGTDRVLASNDDCPGGGWRSCLTFTADSTGFYRVRVRPYPGSAVGPSRTYEIRITPQNDDHGDVYWAASAFVPDGAWLSPYPSFESSTDVDVFRIASAGAQTLTFLGCTNGQAQVQVQLLDSNGNVLTTKTHASCGSSDSYNIGAGTYYLRASAVGAWTGSYLLKATTTLDIDVDSTPANAWPLIAPGLGGTIVFGTRFETSSDEDWFKLDSPGAGLQYVFETWGVDYDTEVELYAPPDLIYGRTGQPDVLPDTSGGQGRGHWMLKDDDGALATKGSRLAFMTPVAGTYYFRVRNKAGLPGRYRVAFLNVDWSWSTWPPYDE